MSRSILSITIALILGFEYHAIAQHAYNVKAAEPITDVDGNVYKTVQIGYQTWMAENLRATKLRNGTPLQNITGNDEWVKTETPSYCWYNNDIEHKNVYGALYNGHIITEEICPDGWALPRSEDWEELITFLGNNLMIGGKLKESGTKHWDAPNYKATNESMFTALPGGFRNPYDGTFGNMGYMGFWWQSTLHPDSQLPQYWCLFADDPLIGPGATEKTMGGSVRCIKDGSDTVPHLTRELVAYYPFNGNTNDESGNGHHATSNGVTFVPDRFGNQNSAISISGESNSISFKDHQVTGPASTLTFWVMPTKATKDTILQNITPLGWKMVLRVVKKHYQLELKIGNKNIVMNDSRGWSNCDPERPRFDFIGISYNEENIRFVVNYRLMSEYYLPVDDLKFKYPINIKQDPSFTFSGILDDVRIYQRSVHDKVLDSLNRDRQKVPPVVTADSLTFLGRDCVRVHSTINFSSIAEPLETGACWSKSPNPDTTHNKITVHPSDVDIVSDLTGLEPNTTYYVRAYAVDYDGLGYSNELSFTTLSALNYDSIYDIDGNTYKTIQIGTQNWMAENLKTTRYANGTPIDDGTFTGSVDGKYYYIYNNDPEYKNTYGLLYTWLAATNGNYGETYPKGVQGACPKGWHIPTKAEKDTLINYLGGPEIAGRKLKESGFAHWNYSPEGGTNESGFTALGAGMRFNFGNGETLFEHKNAITFFWTSETVMEDYLKSPVIYLAEGLSESNEVFQETILGGSVRCIQDQNTTIPIKYGDVDSNTLVQVADALITLKYSVGLNPLPKTDPLPWEDWRIKAADVDTVNGVTAFDASLILLKALGIINTFPAETAKKNLLSPVADVNITTEDGYIVFRSAGDLYGLNIVMNSTSALLGEPQIPDTSIISAVNAGSGSLSVGLASAKVISEGDIVMKIPVSETSGELVIDTKINALNKQFKLNWTPTSVEEMGLTSVEVYPNPANDVLNFRNVPESTVVTVYDLQGKSLISTMVTDSRIDISSLSKGVYFIHISNRGKTVIRKVVK